jgi:rhodanese-related sulfurtransferase
MDQSSISPAALYASIETEAAPIVLDVRRERDFHDDGTMITGGIRRSPEDVDKWASLLSPARSAVVHCVRGGEVSQGIARALASRGISVSFLEGGIAAWRQEQLPTRVKRSADTSRWITRERPKIDRIACPWLIHRFINVRRALHLVSQLAS